MEKKGPHILIFSRVGASTYSSCLSLRTPMQWTNMSSTVPSYLFYTLYMNVSMAYFISCGKYRYVFIRIFYNSSKQKQFLDTSNGISLIWIFLGCFPDILHHRDVQLHVITVISSQWSRWGAWLHQRVNIPQTSKSSCLLIFNYYNFTLLDSQCYLSGWCDKRERRHTRGLSLRIIPVDNLLGQ